MNSWTVLTGAISGLVGISYLGIKLWAPWVFSDLQYILDVVRGCVIPMMSDIKRGKLIISRFEDTVKKHPQKTMLVFEKSSFTYSEGNARANRIAHAAQGLGLKRGDVVAIVLANEPDFIWTVLGMVWVFETANIFLIFWNVGCLLVHLIKKLTIITEKLLQHICFSLVWQVCRKSEFR